MKVTVDGAGMYLTFAHVQPDHRCLVRGNLLHDISPNRFHDRPVGPYSAAGIYLDGNAAGYLFENNVVFKTGSALFVNEGAAIWRDNALLENESPPAEFVEAMRNCAGLEPAYRRSLLKTESSPCDCYPLTEPARAGNLWTGYQFNRAEAGAGVVEVFHRGGSKGDSARFKLRRLNAAATYALKLWAANLEGNGRLRGVQPLSNAEAVLGKGNARMSGRQLMEDGLPVKLTKPQVAWIAYQKLK